MTEDEMVGWHQRLNGHDFEQILEDGEGQGSLVCCSPWGHRESDTTERINKCHLRRPMDMEGWNLLRHLQKHQAPFTERNTTKLPHCCIVSFPQDKRPPDS